MRKGARAQTLPRFAIGVTNNPRVANHPALLPIGIKRPDPVAGCLCGGSGERSFTRTGSRGCMAAAAEQPGPTDPPGFVCAVGIAAARFEEGR